jgi:hypothetical protein
MAREYPQRRDQNHLACSWRTSRPDQPCLIAPLAHATLQAHDVPKRTSGPDCPVPRPSSASFKTSGSRSHCGRPPRWLQQAANSHGADLRDTTQLTPEPGPDPQCCPPQLLAQDISTDPLCQRRPRRTPLQGTDLHLGSIGVRQIDDRSPSIERDVLGLAAKAHGGRPARPAGGFRTRGLSGSAGRPNDSRDECPEHQYAVSPRATLRAVDT